jgi:hypothetical protein
MQNLNALRNIMVSVFLAATMLLILVACTTSEPDTPAAPEEATPPAAASEAPTQPVGGQATLVVQLEGSRTLVRKLDLSAPISGLALLEQSDLDVATANFEWGTAVCSIENVGCPADDCFCNENIFWSYLTWQDDAWVGYPVGPAQSVISTAGAIEGWAWGTGETPPTLPARAEAAHDALAWLRSQQVITDGSFGSSASTSVESLLAVGANHEDGAAWRAAADAPSLLDFVLAHGADHSQGGASETGKLAVALSAADACWPIGAMKPSDYYSPTLGALHSDAGPLSWAILGTLALDEPTPTDSVDYLLSLALPDGGWEWSPGWGRDTNSTALALQALAAAGVPLTNSVIVSGQAYLLSAQSDEGGFSYDPNASWGNVADSNSTAYVLQALAALGVSAPDGAVEFLLGLQGDDGALGWQTAQPAANMGATQQAIPALLVQPYPIQRGALPTCE